MRLRFILALLLAALPAGPAWARASDAGSLLALGNADREALRQAFLAADQRRWQDAVGQARRFRDPIPAKIVTWRRLNLGGSAIGFRDYAAFIEANPDWPRRERLQAHAEQAMDDKLAAADVVAWFTTFPPVTAAGRLRLIEALVARGYVGKAGEWVRYVWQNDELEKDTWRDFYNRYRRFLTQDDNWIRTDNLLWDEKLAAAKRMLQLLPREQRDLVAARIALMTGSAKVNDYIARVTPALRSDPGLMFERLRWRRRYGKDDDIIKLLLAAPGDLGPKPERWWVERGRLARDLLEAGQADWAYKLVAGHGQAPGTPEQAEAEWLAGWLALRFLDDKAAAAEHFLKLFKAVEFPVSKARGAYWRARAVAALGQASQATRWYRIAANYPTTFYGQLAAEALSETPTLRIQPPKQPSDAEWQRFSRREVVRAAVILAELGQWITFRSFILHLAEEAKAPIEHTMLASLATHYRQYELAVRAAKISVRSGEHVAEYGYPLFRLPHVETEPALVFAVMRQESEFRAGAVSSAGASGLMQLMPGTARQVSQAIGLGYSRGRLLSDPNYNVQLGSAYLLDMLRSFDGSYLLAVAAYNAGPGRVRQWIDAFGDPRQPGVDAVDWAERIPFDETRNYVQRVLESLQVYRQRLAGGPTTSELSKDLTETGRGLSGTPRHMP